MSNFFFTNLQIFFFTISIILLILSIINSTKKLFDISIFFLIISFIDLYLHKHSIFRNEFYLIYLILTIIFFVTKKYFLINTVTIIVFFFNFSISFIDSKKKIIYEIEINKNLLSRNEKKKIPIIQVNNQKEKSNLILIEKSGDNVIFYCDYWGKSLQTFFTLDFTSYQKTRLHVDMEEKKITNDITIETCQINSIRSLYFDIYFSKKINRNLGFSTPELYIDDIVIINVLD
jgi:hypothetical protein